VLVSDAGTEHYQDNPLVDKFRATVPEFGQSKGWILASF
jgi:hypothetical protein